MEWLKHIEYVFHLLIMSRDNVSWAYQPITIWQLRNETRALFHCSIRRLNVISRKVSEAAKFVSIIVRSLWHLAGTSAALLRKCLTNFKAMQRIESPISQLRDFAIKRLIGCWNRVQTCYWLVGLRQNLFIYRQPSNISHTLVGNKTVDHSDEAGASPVGAAPTTSSLST